MPPTEPQRLLAFLRDHQAAMTADLIRLVEMESPTNDKAALDRLAAALAEQARGLGAEVTTAPQATAGDHLIARWGNGGVSTSTRHVPDTSEVPGTWRAPFSADGVLLLCHMDTVCDIGTLAQRPIRIEDGRLYGPGAFDMKGGIVNALWAIRALRELEQMPPHRVTLLVTSDEETGSRTSRSLIEAEAQAHQTVFVLEPAHPPAGALKTWRKGTGDYHVTVNGRSAHAGAAHEQGVNAIEELAHHILAIQALTDYAAGTTLNVGQVGGGTRTNVVPEHAWAKVDFRVMNAAEADRLEAAMQGLTPHLPGAAVTVSGGMNRPPMVRTPATVALFQQAQAIAAELGFSVDETGTGGGSDGNFTSALGIPTLDGMGVAGDGGHAHHEHVILSSLPERAALLAAMLQG